MLLKLLSRFPKWFVVVTILVVSTGLFALWWLQRGDSSQKSPIPNGEGKEVVETSDSEVEPQAPEIDVDRVMILCGNTLIDIETGETVIENWLSGLRANTPAAVFYREGKKSYLTRTQAGVSHHGADGSKRLGIKSEQGKLESFAISSDFHGILFTREGDIWRGVVNWDTGLIDDEKKITDVGYFSPKTFGQSFHAWHEDALVILSASLTLAVIPASCWRSVTVGETETFSLKLSRLSSRSASEYRSEWYALTNSERSDSAIAARFGGSGELETSC